MQQANSIQLATFAAFLVGVRVQLVDDSHVVQYWDLLVEFLINVETSLGQNFVHGRHKCVPKVGPEREGTIVI